MSQKIVLSAIALLVALIVPSVSAAQAGGQNNISNIAFEPHFVGVVAGVSTSASCEVPTRTLRRGLRNGDVTALQNFLVYTGYLSADNATGLYGSLTEQAVKRFQAANGIVSTGNAQTTGYGSVGARTLVAMRKACNGGSTVPPMTQTGTQSEVQSTAPTTPPSTTVNKCGANTFAVSGECGQGQYRYATVTCYDGSSELMGGATSCKSTATWQQYAAESCSNKCSDTTPDTRPPIIVDTCEGSICTMRQIPADEYDKWLRDSLNQTNNDQITQDNAQLWVSPNQTNVDQITPSNANLWVSPSPTIYLHQPASGASYKTGDQLTISYSITYEGLTVTQSSPAINIPSQNEVMRTKIAGKYNVGYTIFVGNERKAGGTLGVGSGGSSNPNLVGISGNAMVRVYVYPVYCVPSDYSGAMANGMPTCPWSVVSTDATPIYISPNSQDNNTTLDPNGGTTPYSIPAFFASANTPTYGNAPLTVTFQGNNLPCGTYTLNFGDNQTESVSTTCAAGTTISGPVTFGSHTYTNPANYSATLKKGTKTYGPVGIKVTAVQAPVTPVVIKDVVMNTGSVGFYLNGSALYGSFTVSDSGTQGSLRAVFLLVDAATESVVAQKDFLSGYYTGNGTHTFEWNLPGRTCDNGVCTIDNSKLVAAGNYKLMIRIATNTQTIGEGKSASFKINAMDAPVSSCTIQAVGATGKDGTYVVWWTSKNALSAKLKLSGSSPIPVDLNGSYLVKMGATPVQRTIGLEITNQYGIANQQCGATYNEPLQLADALDPTQPNGGHATADACTNLPGDQTSMPAGYTYAWGGSCVSDGTAPTTPTTPTTPTLPGSAAQRTMWMELYACVLGRKPADSEVTAWVNQKVTSPAVAIRGFFMSNEYINKQTSHDAFVASLYACVLKRPADASGAAVWVTNLQQGTSREAVLNGFTNSTEFKNSIAPAMQSALNGPQVSAPQMTQLASALTALEGALKSIIAALQ